MTPDLRRPSGLRSPILWGGLLLLVFLGWAWRDSVRRWPCLHCGRVSVMSHASGVTFMLTEKPLLWRYRLDGPENAGIFPGSRFSELGELRFARPVAREFKREEWEELLATKNRNSSVLDFPELYFFWGNSPDKNARLAFLPYWCLMLAALLAWLGLIYWRYRSIHRLLATATPGPESIP